MFDSEAMYCGYRDLRMIFPMKEWFQRKTRNWLVIRKQNCIVERKPDIQENLKIELSVVYLEDFPDWIWDYQLTEVCKALGKTEGF